MIAADFICHKQLEPLQHHKIIRNSKTRGEADNADVLHQEKHTITVFRTIYSACHFFIKQRKHEASSFKFIKVVLSAD